MVVDELRRVVLPFLGDGLLPVGDGDEVLAVLGLEVGRDVVGDHLVHRVGSVREGTRPSFGQLERLGRREAVVIGRDGADHAALGDLLAGGRRDHGVVVVVDDLELHSGNEHALDFLRVALLVVDAQRHFLDQAEIASLDGVGLRRRVVGVDAFPDGAVGRDLDAEPLGLAALAVVEVVAGRSLGLLDYHGAQGQGRFAASLTVELGSGDLVLVGVVGESVAVCLEGPGPGRIAGLLGFAGVGVEAVVVFDAELRIGERRGAFRLAAVGRRVHLTQQYSDGVGLGDLDGPLAAVQAGGLARLDLHLVGVLVERIALGALGLLDPIGSRRDSLELALAVGVGRDGAYFLGQPLVGVDRVRGAFERVAAVLVCELAYAGGLGQRDGTLGRELGGDAHVLRVDARPLGSRGLVLVPVLLVMRFGGVVNIVEVVVVGRDVVVHVFRRVLPPDHVLQVA